MKSWFTKILRTPDAELEGALEAFRTQMPIRFESAEEDVWVMGALIDVADDGKARSITQVLFEVDP